MADLNSKAVVQKQVDTIQYALKFLNAPHLDLARSKATIALGRLAAWAEEGFKGNNA